MDANPIAPGQDHRRGHEPVDIGLRPIVIFVVALVATAVVIQVLVGMQLLWYVRDQSPAAGAIVPLPKLAHQPTAEPRLQEAPVLDLDAMRRRDRLELQSSGWVDEKARTVKIPIEDAMRLIAEKGLPTRKSRAGSEAGTRPKTPSTR